MTVPRTLTNPWVRERAIRLRDALATRLTSARFWFLLLLGVLLAGALWIAITGWSARGELDGAHAAATSARAAAARGDLPAATAAAGAMRAHAARAHALTGGPAWATAAAVPWAGAPLRTVRGLAAAADDLGAVTADLPALSRAAKTTTGGIDLHGATADTVRRATTTIARLRSTVDGLPHHTWLSTVDDARAEAAGALAAAGTALAAADRRVSVADIPGVTRTVTRQPREPCPPGDLPVPRRLVVRPLQYTSSSQECG